MTIVMATLIKPVFETILWNWFLSYLHSCKQLWFSTCCCTPISSPEKDLEKKVSAFFSNLLLIIYMSPKQKIVLIVTEVQNFCLLFQLHPDFSQLRPGCNWNSTQKCSIFKTVSTIFCFIVFIDSDEYLKSNLRRWQILFFKSFSNELKGVDEPKDSL
jgi:hypothetical protein